MSTETQTTTQEATQAAPAGGLRPEDIKVQGAQYEQPGGMERAMRSTEDWEPNDPLLQFLNDVQHPNQNTGLHPSTDEPFAVPKHVYAGRQQGHQTEQAQGQAQQGQAQQGQAQQGQQGQATSQQQSQSGNQQGTQTQQSQQQQQGQTQQGQTQQGQNQQGQASQGETIESLKTQLQQLQQVQTLVQSQDYKDAMAVLTLFRKDPVAFYREYVPSAHEQIQKQDMALTMPPEDFAREFARMELAKKYKDDFEFDQSEALIPGTPSNTYIEDRQLLLNKGMQVYYGERARLQHEEAQRTEQLHATGRKVAQDFGIPADAYERVAQLAESIEMTPELHFRMVYMLLDSMGKLNEFKSQAGQQQKREVPFVPSNDLPMPGVQRLPGASADGNAVPQSLEETFGRAFVFDEF